MKKRDPHEDNREHKKGHEREEPKQEYGGREHHQGPHGTGYGTERSVYEEYLARKWEGSEPPSPQAYARAIRLWRQLPGSIMSAPADLGTVPEPPKGEERNRS